MMEKYIDLDEILKIFKEVDKYEDLFHMDNKKMKILADISHFPRSFIYL